MPAGALIVQIDAKTEKSWLNDKKPTLRRKRGKNIFMITFAFLLL